MRRYISILIALVLLLGIFPAYAEDRPDNTWVPSEGYSLILDSTVYTDTFYLSASWSWDSDARLSGFSDSNETFELDYVCGEDYGFSNEWYNYASGSLLKGTYWDTNQPRPYWDTIAFDSDEIAFSVGCSDATMFEKDVTYYWWAYCKENPNFTDDEAKISAQRGYRLSPFVYEDTWNVFSEETVKIVPYSDWSVPSTKSWTFN